MGTIHTLSSGYTIDLSKIQIVSSVSNGEFFIMLDHDGSSTFTSNSQEQLDVGAVHEELLQAWKDYSATHQA